MGGETEETMCVNAFKRERTRPGTRTEREIIIKKKKEKSAEPTRQDRAKKDLMQPFSGRDLKTDGAGTPNE